MALVHFDHDGRARFVTFNTHQRMSLLTNRVFCDVVDAAIQSAARETGCRLLARVVMPEHVHMVLVPHVEIKLADVVSDMKRRSAREIHALLVERRSPLLARLSIMRDGQQRFVFWQRRCYDRNCRSEDEVWRAVQYCHQNPVARGLVRRTIDYPWSSALLYEEDNTPE